MRMYLFIWPTNGVTAGREPTSEGRVALSLKNGIDEIENQYNHDTCQKCKTVKKKIKKNKKKSTVL